MTCECKEKKKVVFAGKMTRGTEERETKKQTHKWHGPLEQEGETQWTRKQGGRT